MLRKQTPKAPRLTRGRLQDRCCGSRALSGGSDHRAISRIDEFRRQDEGIPSLFDPAGHHRLDATVAEADLTPDRAIHHGLDRLLHVA
jgi:hypothetical protein